MAILTSPEEGVTASMDERLNRAPCGYLSFTDDGRIVVTNATLADLLGYEQEALAGSKLESILTLANRIFYQTHFFPLLRLHEKAEEIFLVLRARDGSEVPVLVNAARRLEGGRFVNDCVFLQVRERKKYEEELLRAKKAAEEALQNNETLTAARDALEHHARELDDQRSRLEQKNQELLRLGRVLSHDMREPIRKVILFADILHLENRETLTPMGLTAVQRINEACRRMDDLIQTLQQYVGVDAAGGTPEPVNLNDVVSVAQLQIYEKTKFGGLEVKADPLPTIQGFRPQLETLFYQLFDNAVKFRKPDVPLEVEIEAYIVQQNSYRSISGKYRYIDFVRLLVRDNGMGFDDRYSEYVFDVLRKVNVRTEGLGFGLPLCKKVVENHGGNISIASTPGEGTQVTILLPLGEGA